MLGKADESENIAKQYSATSLTEFRCFPVFLAETKEL